MASPEEEKLIDAIVKKYESDIKGFERLTQNLYLLLSDLQPLVHSIRARPKDPGHFRGKLLRKLEKSKKEGKEFLVTPDNLFSTINDLAGIRLLHLNTSQFPQINESLLKLLTDEGGYRVVEGPVARIWDGEYREIFKSMGIKTEENDRMYTSVHYVVEESSRSKRTAEIQVRTLAEELWGEVDHSLNYPVPCNVPSCREQIKVLARATSACTRLVDSIFFSKDEAENRGGKH